MATTIDIVGSSNGCLGSARNLVWIGNTAWAFAYDGTQQIASYYSSDLVTWYAGATYTLLNPHLGEGRNLSVTYKNIGGVDVIHVAIVYKATTMLGVNAIRATVAGTALTWHVVETAISTPTGDSGALYWSSPSVE